MMSSSVTTVGKPPPHATALSAPYWRAIQQGRLILQRCRGCRCWQHYPRALCARCWSSGLSWEAACGRGWVWSYTLVRRAPHPAWERDVPYYIAIITLAEGTRLLANLVNCRPGSVRVGQEVHAVFEEREGYAVVQFTPKEASAG